MSQEAGSEVSQEALDRESLELDELVGWRSDPTAEPPEDLAATTIDRIVEVVRASESPSADVVPLPKRAPADWRAKYFRWAMAAAAVLVFGGGYWIYDHHQVKAAEIAAKAAEARRLQEESETKQKELEAKIAEVRFLEDRLKSAADPEEIERLRKQIEDAKSDARRRGGAGFRPAGKAGAAEPAKAHPQR